MATYTPISGITPQYSTTNNELASGYYLKFYKSGTTTPLSVATSSSGATTLAKVKLNPLGMPISNPLDDDTIFIPHVSENYRVVLYVNETDADNDDTASAVFNIDGLAPDAQQLGDAADITLRQNTLENQDDYDRSPLFVDGTDFTAGAGPHTITVPSGWDPTGEDFRIWRLDTSTDIAEALTPTATTTSSFTLAETLLSTDVIYIGDDEFRNIHDGDPADIRSRLAVYSKTEGDARYLGEANNLSDLDDAATARANLGIYGTSSIWTGTTTSFDFDTDPPGGDPGTGLYMVNYSGSSDAFTIFRPDPALGLNTSVTFQASGATNQAVTAVLRSNGVLTVRVASFSGGTDTDQDINQVWKIG